MSAFDTLMSAADDVLFSTSTFGDSGTYQPTSGDPSTITAIIVHQVDPRPDESEYRIHADTVEIHIRASDIAQPKRGDTFTTSTHVYTISHTDRSDGTGSVYVLRARKAAV